MSKWIWKNIDDNSQNTDAGSFDISSYSITSQASVKNFTTNIGEIVTNGFPFPIDLIYKIIKSNASLLSLSTSFGSIVINPVYYELSYIFWGVIVRVYPSGNWVIRYDNTYEQVFSSNVVIRTGIINNTFLLFPDASFSIRIRRLYYYFENYNENVVTYKNSIPFTYKTGNYPSKPLVCIEFDIWFEDWKNFYHIIKQNFVWEIYIGNTMFKVHKKMLELVNYNIGFEKGFIINTCKLYAYIIT